MPELDEVIEFFTERFDENKEMADGTEVPDHGEAMIVSDAADLLKTAQQADNRVLMTDDGEGIDDEEIDSALAEAAVNVLTSVFAFAYERDLDLSAQIEEQMEFIENFEAFNEAMENADTEAEQMKVMDEKMTEEMMEMMGVEQGPEVGDNVDDDEYEPSGIGRGVQ